MPECGEPPNKPQGDYVVVCLQGDDPAHMVSKYLSSDAPVDRWFTETILGGMHGVDVSHPHRKVVVMTLCARGLMTGASELDACIKEA